MSNQNLAELLEQVQFAYTAGVSLDTVLPTLTQLAQAHYQPATDFFAACLDDGRLEWRWQCLLFLCLHYDLTDYPMALDKVRQALQSDPESQLRIKAADFLTLYATWPEPSLVTAMETDPDPQVRLAAFKAILELLGIPRLIIKDEASTLYVRGVLPTMADVERISKDASQRRQSHF